MITVFSQKLCGEHKNYLGVCALESNLESITDIDSKTSLCVKSFIVSDYFYSRVHSFSLTDYEAYFGFHFFKNFSFHLNLKGFYLANNKDKQQVNKFSPDLLAVNFGNKIFDRFSLSLGKLKPTFGIDENFINGYFNYFSRKDFWLPEIYGAIISFDDFSNTLIQLSAGRSFLYDENNLFRGKLYEQKSINSLLPSITRSLTTSSTDIFALRAMSDISGLYQSRVLFSLANTSKNYTQLSLGLINISNKNQIFQFEWIRILTNPKTIKKDFDQLFRIIISNQESSVHETTLIYEDTKSYQRLLTLYQEIKLTKYLKLRTSINYIKNELPPQNSHWGFSLGAKAIL